MTQQNLPCNTRNLSYQPFTTKLGPAESRTGTASSSDTAPLDDVDERRPEDFLIVLVQRAQAPFDDSADRVCLARAALENRRDYADRVAGAKRSHKPQLIKPDAGD